MYGILVQFLSNSDPAKISFAAIRKTAPIASNEDLKDEIRIFLGLKYNCQIMGTQQYADWRTAEQLANIYSPNVISK